MIIPTADFDPFFADDGTPFQEKMLSYIQSEFADIIPQSPQAQELIELNKRQAQSATVDSEIPSDRRVA